MIKMYAWEKAFLHTIKTIRDKELVKILTIQFINLFEHAISNSIGYFGSFFIFMMVLKLDD